MKYRGIIKNEEGKVIFSRAGNFNSEEQCLQALHQRVINDFPSEHSMFHNMLFSGSFENSSFCLKRYYKDISRLTFMTEKI